MVLVNWVLPILIGIVASIALISILYNNRKVKDYFADILGTKQDDYFKLDLYETKKWQPITYNQNETIENNTHCNSSNLDNTNLKITSIDSPLYIGNNKDMNMSIYNYYPKVLVN